MYAQAAASVHNATFMFNNIVYPIYLSEKN